MIKEKTIKSEEKKVYIVEIDGYTEECHSAASAKTRLKELKEKKEKRLKDFLIAEKLFDYVWVSPYDQNYLISPWISNSRYTRDDEKGKKYPDSETNGIFFSSMTYEKGWEPPNFEKSDFFLDLISALISKGACVTFSNSMYDKDEVACWVECDDRNFDEEVIIKKKEDWWNVNYCAILALKEAAYLFAKTL